MFGESLLDRPTDLLVDAVVEQRNADDHGNQRKQDAPFEEKPAEVHHNANNGSLPSLVDRRLRCTASVA
jgi:hypothetical protein